MVVKGVIFDFWGTLVENGVYPSPVSQVKYFLRLKEMGFHDYIVRFENVFMTRKHENLTDAFNKVCKEFKVSPPSWVVDKMVGMWNKNMLLAKPFPETIEVLEKMKKDYKIGLVSNTDPFSVEPIIKKFDMERLFDAQVFSYNVGSLKGDNELYEKCLKQMKLKKEEVIMVGDSIESDINSANNFGINPILLDRRNKREYEHKIVTLDELPEALKKF